MISDAFFICRCLDQFHRRLDHAHKSVNTALFLEPYLGRPTCYELRRLNFRQVDLVTHLLESSRHRSRGAYRYSSGRYIS